MRAFVPAFIRQCITALSLTIPLMGSAWAQDQAGEIRAVTGVVPPFVTMDGDRLTGFSVDLWNEVAARLKLKTTYQLVTDSTALIEVMRTKNADVIVAPIFYSTERDKEFDFSYPILEAGLQILVRGGGANAEPTPLKDVLALLFSRSAAIWLGVGLIIILIPAHLVWLLDRGREEGVSPTKNYFPGIFHAMVWAATALVSQVQVMPMQWLARVLGLLWMFAGVVFIALYTAQLTASLTVEQFRGAISGPGDLPGKRVATFANSPAEDYLRKIGADVVVFSSTGEIYAALLDQNVDAVVWNAPALQYYATHDGNGRVSVVGPEIDRQDIGFVFPLGSPLRKKVGSVLIALREDGTYQRIYDKYFGSE